MKNGSRSAMLLYVFRKAAMLSAYSVLLLIQTAKLPTCKDTDQLSPHTFHLAALWLHTLFHQVVSSPQHARHMLRGKCLNVGEVSAQSFRDAWEYSLLHIEACDLQQCLAVSVLHSLHSAERRTTMSVGSAPSSGSTGKTLSAQSVPMLVRKWQIRVPSSSGTHQGPTCQIMHISIMQAEGNL